MIYCVRKSKLDGWLNHMILDWTRHKVKNGTSERFGCKAVKTTANEILQFRRWYWLVGITRPVQRDRSVVKLHGGPADGPRPKAWTTCRRRRSLRTPSTGSDSLLRTPSAGSDPPPPWLSRIRASPARHLRHHLYFLSLVQTLGRGLTVGSPWSSSTPLSLGRGRVAPPPRRRSGVKSGTPEDSDAGQSRRWRTRTYSWCPHALQKEFFRYMLH